MFVTVLTLFPEMFAGFVSSSILERARIKNLVTFRTINIRDFALDKHRSVDDAPYGGGQGMLMRVDVVHRALDTVLADNPEPRSKTKIILLDAGGDLWSQKSASLHAKNFSHLIMICGHYEGIDARIKEYVDETVSIGQYVITGGELAAAVITDSIVRLLPGVLGDENSAADESFTGDDLAEYPQYTRPQLYDGKKVPEVLLSGNHAEIRQWKSKSRKKTKA